MFQIYNIFIETMRTDKLETIKLFNATRDKDKVALKYKIMTENPFRFFRGTCHLFYKDLLKQHPFPASPNAWLCGDLHTENFGSFKGANRLVYFDMVDFDEATLAPILWDIARLATSIVLVADQIKLPLKEKKNVTNLLLKQYQQQLLTQKAVAVELETATGLIKTLFEKVTLRKEKDILKRRTTGHALVTNDKLLPLPKKVKDTWILHFEKWFHKTISKEFKIVDVGFRIAGTGSIGIKRYLCLAEHQTKKGKKLLIDVKEALPSSLQKGTSTTYTWPHEAARIIETQTLLQHVSPAFLSPYHDGHTWYVVKELQPTDDKVSIEAMVSDPKAMADYMRSLGILAASAHLRGSGRRGAASADEIKQFIDKKEWLKAVSHWAMTYAEQVHQDYLDFCKAYKKGYFNEA